MSVILARKARRNNGLVPDRQPGLGPGYREHVRHRARSHRLRRLRQHRDRDNAANGDRFKFAGMQYDATTGQYYDHARWYGAGVGGFLTQDPIGFAAGDPDLYRYVGNDPANATDPTGLQYRITWQITEIMINVGFGVMHWWKIDGRVTWDEGDSPPIAITVVPREPGRSSWPAETLPVSAPPFAPPRTADFSTGWGLTPNYGPTTVQPTQITVAKVLPMP